MTATQIADLGGAIYGDADQTFYGERWMRRVLHDAPTRIDPITLPADGLTAGKIGEIVHKVVRRWRPTMHAADLHRALDALAWEEGIVHTQTRADVVAEAERLMQQVLGGQVLQWVRAADPVYSELPFVFQTGERLIHGVIDVLMRRDDGTWALVDYKPTFVASHASEEALAAHAQRYHLQMGVYAAAARELLGIDQVEVYIYYIRHGQSVKIPPDAWHSALEHLEEHISSLMRMDER
jgi:ATP-dependent exoDNAse (exonuclease V) beta subunit